MAKLAKAKRSGMAHLSIGASDEGVHLKVPCGACGNETEFILKPEDAEDLSVELGTRAIEVRNGGGLG